MILLLCWSCGSARTVHHLQPTVCGCGRSQASYINNQVCLKGENAYAIGIANGSILRAVRHVREEPPELGIQLETMLLSPLNPVLTNASHNDEAISPGGDGNGTLNRDLPSELPSTGKSSAPLTGGTTDTNTDTD